MRGSVARRSIARTLRRCTRSASVPPSTRRARVRAAASRSCVLIAPTSSSRVFLLGRFFPLGRAARTAAPPPVSSSDVGIPSSHPHRASTFSTHLSRRRRRQRSERRGRPPVVARHSLARGEEACVQLRRPLVLLPSSHCGDLRVPRLDFGCERRRGWAPRARLAAIIVRAQTPARPRDRGVALTGVSGRGRDFTQ